MVRGMILIVKACDIFSYVFFLCSCTGYFSTGVYSFHFLCIMSLVLLVWQGFNTENEPVKGYHRLSDTHYFKLAGFISDLDLKRSH